MATVHVTTVNNSGKSVTLSLDDERDKERIDYLKKLARREDLADVKVAPSKAPAKRAAAKLDED